MQQKTSSSQKVARVFGRVFAWLGVTVSVVLLAAVGCVAVLCKGPSVTAQALFVTTASQNKITALLPRLFLSAEQVQAIAQQNTVLPVETASTPLAFTGQSGAASSSQTQQVSGAAYAGTLLLVAEPSRVSLAANVPQELVFSGGEQLQGDTAAHTIAAFDAEHRLLVGKLTAAQAAERGVRDAVCSPAALLVDGKPAQVLGTGGGLSHLTAIGQRADGTVLVLTLAGKAWWQPGATYQDCLAVMQQHGAVNAAVLNDTFFLSGQQQAPTAVIVK